MNRKTLLASALTVLMAGSASLVMAQTAPPPPPAAADSRQGHGADTRPAARRHHGMRGGDWHGHDAMATAA